MSETNGFRYLLIVPFSKEPPVFRKLIADALQEVGIVPISPEETIPGMVIVESVQQEIARADIIIANLTESNPNVMYEVGFAHALRKPVMLIIQQGASLVPFDLIGYLYFVYDPSKPDELRRNIQTWATRYYKERMRGELEG